MTVRNFFVAGLVSLILIGVSACNSDPVQTIPLISVYVNDKVGSDVITVTTSPMTLRGTTRLTTKQALSVEFFDGSKLLGIVTAGVKRGDGTEVNFTLSVPITAADNGEHSYKAVFTYDGPSNLSKLTSELIKATIKL